MNDVVAGIYIKASPAPPGTGLVINGVPVKPGNVAKADARVDLGVGLNRSLIVEHVTGPSRLLGLTDVFLEGIATPWDFMRPEHRLVYSTGQPNSFVVGPPDGRLNPDFVEAVLAAGVRELPGPRRRRTVEERVHFEIHGGYIDLLPAPFGAGITLNLRLGPHVVSDFHFDPQEGLEDKEFLRTIVNSPTPFLIGWEDPRAATHAIGDVCGDLTGVGGFSDLNVEAELSFFYHALTIGAVRAARVREGEI
ncbi:MAG: hypothetical protein ACOY40_04130 [Bacillota bacterium]